MTKVFVVYLETAYGDNTTNESIQLITESKLIATLKVEELQKKYSEDIRKGTRVGYFSREVY